MIGFNDFEFNLIGEILQVDTVSELCVGAIPACRSGGIYRVPNNKVLIIDQVSYSGTIIPSGVPDSLIALLHIIHPNSNGEFAFSLGEAVRIGSGQWLGSSLMAIRAPAGSQIVVRLLWNESPPGQASGSADIAGRLVDAQ